MKSTKMALEDWQGQRLTRLAERWTPLKRRMEMHAETKALLANGRQRIALGEDWQHQLLSIGTDNDNVPLAFVKQNECNIFLLFAWAGVWKLNAEMKVNEIVINVSLISQKL